LDGRATYSDRNADDDGDDGDDDNDGDGATKVRRPNGGW
jgi:hypothetical protein